MQKVDKGGAIRRRGTDAGDVTEAMYLGPGRAPKPRQGRHAKARGTAVNSQTGTVPRQDTAGDPYPNLHQLRLSSRPQF